MKKKENKKKKEKFYQAKRRSQIKKNYPNKKFSSKYCVYRVVSKPNRKKIATKNEPNTTSKYAKSEEHAKYERQQHTSGPTDADGSTRNRRLAEKTLRRSIRLI